MNEAPLYILERYKHGWAIRSSPGQSGIPLDALNEALKLCPDKCTVIDAGLSNNIGANVVFGKPSELKLWRREAQELLDVSLHPLEIKWLLGMDTGISSLTLFVALCESSYKGVACRNGFGTDRADIPYDADDFRRCYRLIKLFPHWEPRLPEVSQQFPKWSPIVKAWVTLKTLFEQGDNKSVTELLRSTATD